MRILVTGHAGYLGSVMTPLFQSAGHEVVGMDSGLYDSCTMGENREVVPLLRMDIRDVQPSHLAGFDAIVHLAALSNDPLGNLDPSNTYDINHRASVNLAEAARRARVPRFLFASSCSLYGVADDAVLTEDAEFNPVTPYAQSKVWVERDVSVLASDTFTPIFLRNATAYGFSPRLRLDVVVNNLVGAAYATGEVLIESDGSPWRPLVHVEDIGRAFLAALDAPQHSVHNQAFNVGRTDENYQVRDLAEMVCQVVPGSRVRYAVGGEPDPRCYRVDCRKIAQALPGFEPRWTVRQGIEQLYDAYRLCGLDGRDWSGPKYFRVRQIQKLVEEGRLNAALRWTGNVVEAGHS